MESDKKTSDVANNNKLQNDDQVCAILVQNNDGGQSPAKKANRGGKEADLLNLFQPPAPKSRNHESTNTKTGGAGSSLMGLFQPPDQPKKILKDDEKNRPRPEPMSRRSTEVCSNTKTMKKVRMLQRESAEEEGLLSKADKDDSVRKMFANKNYSTMMPASSSQKFHSSKPSTENAQGATHLLTKLKGCVSCDKKEVLTTIVGSCTFVLYHVVYALSQASAVQSKRIESSLLGPLARMGALGCITAGPIMIHFLNGTFEIPSTYPTVDAFLVPFYALMGRVIDETIPFDKEYEDDINEIWLATFTVASAIGMVMSGIMMYLAAIFKIANLGAFLPYPVLCGFFTAIGIMMEQLALSVDTNGLSTKQIFLEPSNYIFVLKHHAPSLLIGTLMFVITKKYTPVLTPVLSVGSIICVYLVMLLTGTSLKEAQSNKWFWTSEAFQFNAVSSNGDKVEFAETMFNPWSPPAPMGFLASLWNGKVYFPAVSECFPISFAMATIYLVRCSLHAPALKKNATNLYAWKREQVMKMEAKKSNGGITQDKETHPDDYLISIASIDDEEEDKTATIETDTKSKPSGTVADLMKLYGVGQIISAFIGGFPCLPTIASGATLFKLGAEKAAPQYGASILFFFFYLTDFELVSYIPKCTFSCLLVLCAFDLLNGWFVVSYKKVHNKGEWMVVPAIVIFTFTINILSAVGVGIALSTFVFVGTFYRTGVVKFIANGLTLRSTIERGVNDDEYLDMNGDLIQVLVLQNYLFFGNASSCLNYITTMFEDMSADTAGESLNFSLPPIPKYLIIDLGFVTGFDTSAIDVFLDIVQLAKSSDCFVYITGLSREQKKILAAGGLKPSTKHTSIFSKLKFFHDMETALGKAEDGVLKQMQQDELIRTQEGADSIEPGNGFLYALEQIDIQHGVKFASRLKELESFTTPIELKTGQSLYSNGGGPIDDAERGLFFIEHGLMRVERDSSYTTSRSIGRGSENSLRRRSDPSIIYATPRLGSTSSIGQLNARSHTVGREQAMLKAAQGYRDQNSLHNFRLARIGPGWVVGCMEGSASLRNPGLYIAVTPCRLHHVPYHKIEEIELENPTLVLNLFKLMARLTARRQEITIGQLATIHSIVTSPAPTKPISRMTMGAIQSAMDRMDYA